MANFGKPNNLAGASNTASRSITIRDMRLSLLVLLASSIFACSPQVSEGPPIELPPAGQPPPATAIQIVGSVAPQLVVFRDGIDAPWQAATMADATTYSAVVHGPYVVTFVCVASFHNGLLVLSSANQVAATPDDPHTIIGCQPSEPLTYTVTGQAVQPGSVELGGFPRHSTTPNWTFQLPTVPGTFDLIASSVDRLIIQRGIAVTGDVTLPSPIDFSTGVPLVPTAFTVAGATADETVEVKLGVINPTTQDYPAQVYRGPTATAMVAPTSALLPTDTQIAEVNARSSTTTRTISRPFQLGESTAFTLPAPLDVQWSISNGDLSLSWSSLPPANGLSFGSRVSTTNVDLDASKNFLVATGLTALTADTDIPGFQPAWKTDLTGEYERSLGMEVGDEIDPGFLEYEIDESVNAPSSSTALPHLARSHRSPSRFAAHQ